MALLALSTDRQLVRFRARADDSRRQRLLVCFHHAGAGASSFAAWPVERELDADVACVQLKGREDRFAQPLDDSLPALADEVADALSHTDHRDLVLLGHSMGGLLAWWSAAALLQRHSRRCQLVVSAQVPDPATRLARSSGDDLRGWFARLGEPWPAVLDDPQMHAILSETLDTDIAWLRRECSRPRPGPLPLTLHTIGWASDTLVPPGEMLRWRSCTSRRFTSHTLPGGHLELFARPAPALALLRKLLDESVHDAP